MLRKTFFVVVETSIFVREKKVVDKMKFKEYFFMNCFFVC